MWSVLEKVSWAAEKNVYCPVADGILCRHPSDPLDLWCFSLTEFLYLFFV
jgi:hypothetical protein